jgi:predicted nucleic-acid-binding protein
MMIGLDTNILARYYIEDETDGESLKQREAARRLIESGGPLGVCKTVLLELEWVMRGYYRLDAEAIATVLHHLLSLPHIHIEERGHVEKALLNYAEGLDFADALHHAAYAECESMASFDDRKFSRRVKRLGLKPRVFVPE